MVTVTLLRQPVTGYIQLGVKQWIEFVLQVFDLIFDYTSTAVLLGELIKLIICLYMAGRNQILETGQFNIPEIYSQVFAHYAWKFMIPAAVYTIQNNFRLNSLFLLGNYYRH